MEYPVVVTLSGPESTRAKAEIALEKAHLTIIPPREWPIQRESYRAEHWPHLTPINLVYDPIKDEHVLPDPDIHSVPDGYLDDLEHGFLAVLADTEQAFHAAYGVVEHAGWVLRVHYELPAKPEPDPITATLTEMRELIAAQDRKIAALEAARGV